MSKINAVEKFISDISKLNGIPKNWLFPKSLCDKDYLDYLIDSKEVKKHLILPVLKEIADGKLGINGTVHQIMESLKKRRDFSQLIKDKKISKQLSATEKYINKTLKQLRDAGHFEPKPMPV